MRRGGIGVCVATQIARWVHRGNPLSGLALGRTGVGDDPGAARLVPGDGRTRRAESGGRPRVARPAAREVGRARSRRRLRDWIRPQPRGRRLPRDPCPSRARVCIGSPCARSRALRAGHLRRRERNRKADSRRAGSSCSRKWIASASYSTSHTSRTRASGKRWTASRTGVGEPLERPCQGAAPAPARRCHDPRARGPGSRHRRRARRLDAGAGLAPRSSPLRSG